MVLPNTSKRAINSLYADKWRAATNTAKDSLEQHEVYNIMLSRSRLPRAGMIGPRWIFKLKEKNTNKARLVVQE